MSRYESDEDWASREAAIADRGEQIRDHREGRDQPPDSHPGWHYPEGETKAS